MKISLIRYHSRDNVNTRLPASLNKRQGAVPPLGIAYIAAVLERAGHNVQMIDAVACALTAQETQEQLRDFSPALVGVTCMTPDFHGALEAARIAKSCGAKVVLGGPHISIFPDETLSYEFVDFGIDGEGEETMADLAAALERGEDFSKIRGLIYRKDGHVVANPSRIVENLDSLPMPAYHLLPMHLYHSIIGLEKVSTMISSRGCPFRCGFCFKTPSDAKHRMRSPKLVVDEMEHLVRKYDVSEIMFYDDVMTVSHERTTAICEEIVRRGLKVKWETPTRIDVMNRTLLRTMKRAGCIRLRYGVESGNEEILRLMNKQISKEKVKEVFAMTRAEGIETFAYFMLGYPHETEKTMQETIDFAIELNPDKVMFTATTPLPATPLYDLAVREKLVAPDYWRNFVLGRDMTPLGAVVPGAEAWVKKAYRSFYLRPSYVLRSLAKIRSWHQFKMHLSAAAGIIFFKMRD